MKVVRLAACVAVVAAGGILAAPAGAATELVTGTTAGTLALANGTGAVLSPFGPGVTGTGSGSLVATDTSPSWTLSVKDAAASNAGHMAAAGTGCTGSDPSLTNALSVGISSLLGGVNATAPVSISGTNQTVASATNQLLAANALTTNYSQDIPSTQVMVTGCVYSLTATYTLG